METETTTRLEFGKAIIEEILHVRRKKEIQKRRSVRVTVRDLSRENTHLSKII